MSHTEGADSERQAVRADSERGRLTGQGRFGHGLERVRDDRVENAVKSIGGREGYRRYDAKSDSGTDCSARRDARTLARKVNKNDEY